MLKAANPEAVHCYDKAAEAKQQAYQAKDARMRDELLASEARWLKLAASYEFSERLNRFVGHSAAVPNHPLCRRCRVPMWLVEVQAGPATTDYHFECKACGETQTLARF